MKSDREFIEGIYEKAERSRDEKFFREIPEELQSDKERDGGRGGKILHFPRMAAAAAVMILCIGTAAFGLLKVWNHSGTGTDPLTDTQSVVTRMVPGQESEAAGTPAAAQFALDLPDGGFSLTGCTVEGEVSSVLDPDEAGVRAALIDAADWLEGAPEPEPQTVTLHYSDTDEYGRSIVFTAGERVLLFLNAKDEEGGFIYYLANGAESKYAFLKDEDGTEYYQNPDGAVLDITTLRGE